MTNTMFRTSSTWRLVESFNREENLLLMRLIKKKGIIWRKIPCLFMKDICLVIVTWNMEVTIRSRIQKVTMLPLSEVTMLHLMPRLREVTMSDLWPRMQLEVSHLLTRIKKVTMLQLLTWRLKVTTLPRKQEVTIAYLDKSWELKKNMSFTRKEGK